MMTFKKNTKKISCALYLTSNVAKNPIFRAHNLKYKKSWRDRLILILDSDSTSKITPEMVFRFPTTNTNPLFADLCNESTLHQQLHNVAKIPLNYVETCPNISQTQPHEPAFVIDSGKTWYPSCKQLPHAQTFMKNVSYAFHWNVYNLTNLTHFQSMIVEYDVVDFIDHFLRSHLFWTAKTLRITCANTVATKFSETLMNRAMRWSRLLIISCRLFFSFFDWFSS